jgi:peptidoglycan L-alanyl-D-glutamate endopeptidase CwlK
VPAPRTERVQRDEAVRDTTNAEKNEREPRINSADFAQLLALLSGQSETVRADLVKQLPAEGASLVDALLDGALLEGEAAAAADEVAVTEAEEALRNGLLKMPRAERGDVVDLAAYARTREARLSGMDGLGGLAGAMTNITEHGNDNALDALARVAARRGASIEQLLAVGDARGADARAALDALLSKAGTPSGLKLANAAGDKRAAMDIAQDILSETTGSAFADDDTEDTSRLGSMTHAHGHGADAALAHSTALAAATAANAATPSSPAKNLDAVSPELRGKVERVIERMKNEYGHDVQVVETARSQERQDWLYAQGRTRNGPVVTWTRDSAHTRGEAVDVMIDGSWDNAEGFGRLQRIAREEGLRTLGMKDPGHLELAKGQGMPDDLTARVERAQASARGAAAANASSGAAAANVAQVAGVAQVASVANVTDAAAPGNAGDAAAYTALTQQPARTEQQSQGNAFGRGDRDEQGNPLNSGRKLGHEKRAGETADSYSALQQSATSTGSAERSGQATAATASAPVASTQAQRVSDIQALRADAPASPLNRMTLNVDGVNGEKQQVTVDVRGNVVSTQINTDAATADRLRMRTADLQDALGRRGLESDTVKISGLKPVDGTSAGSAVGGERDALKVASTASSNAQDGANANGQRERAPSRDWNQDESRREQASRARDQREQRDQQQDRRRPRPDFLFGNP